MNYLAICAKYPAQSTSLAELRVPDSCQSERMLKESAVRLDSKEKTGTVSTGRGFGGVRLYLKR